MPSRRPILATLAAAVIVLVATIPTGCSESDSSNPRVPNARFTATFEGLKTRAPGGVPYLWATFKVVNDGAVPFTQHTLQIVRPGVDEPLYGGEKGITTDGFFPANEKYGPDLKTRLNPDDTGYISVVLDMPEADKPVQAVAILTLGDPDEPDSLAMRKVFFTIPPTSQTQPSGS